MLLISMSLKILPPKIKTLSDILYYIIYKILTFICKFIPYSKVLIYNIKYKH